LETEKVIVVLRPHLGVIFPYQMPRIADEIRKSYESIRLTVPVFQQVTFSEEKAREFYADQIVEDFSSDFLKSAAGGPSIVMIVEGTNVVQKIEFLHGPSNPNECKERHLNKIYCGEGEDGLSSNFHCSGPDNYERECQLIFGVIV
jgi:nucleoside diphosphate kinase